MMRRGLFGAVVALLACSGTKPIEVKDAVVVAKLERKECLGRCPVYSVTAWSNGNVEWSGENCVRVRGEAQKQVGPETLRALDAAFKDAKYCALESEYVRVDRTDADTRLTSYSGCGFFKSVRHYHGDNSAPTALTALEDTLDRLLKTSDWIGNKEERQCSDGLRDPR